MKAVVVYEAGGPEKLVYKEVPKPILKKEWSLVKVMGFGVNHSEIFTREGKSPSVHFPRILGIECVGIIEETSDENLFRVGQKVISIMGEMGRSFDGSYAEYVLLPNEQIYPIETDLSWEELATIPETYYTAFGSMKNLQIKESDQILVRGATSGVGIAFLNLIRSQFKTIHVEGTSRNLATRELLIQTGFDDVIEDKNGQLQTEKTYDKIIELIGPATVKDSFNHINEHGIVCSTGQLGGQWFLKDFDPITDIKANSYLTSFYSDNVDGSKLSELFQFIEKNKLTVKPEKVFELKDSSKAHAFIESNHSFGKVVILNKDLGNYENR